MKHQEIKERDAYARRYGELVAENVAMRKRIHRLVGGYNKVVEKLSKLRDKYDEVLTDFTKAKAAHEELSKGYTNVCNANMVQGREADYLRKELTKIQSENVNLKRERSILIDLLEEKGFTLVKNTECPHDMVETGEPFCKESLETVTVDSCACWNCEFFCLRLKDRGKIVCKEGQGRKPEKSV